MRTKEQILDEIHEIQTFLANGIPQSDIHSMTEALSKATIYLASSASMLADAEYHYNEAKHTAYHSLSNINDDKGKPKPPSLVKDFINTKCKLEARIFTLAERINAALTHMINSTITTISAEKSLAYASKFGG